jgi:hypothetical protein
MADETGQDQPPDLEGAATPNRDRPREPPVVIEGEVAGAPENIDARPFAGPPDIGPPPAEGVGAQPPSVGARPILSAAIGAVVGAAVAAGGLWFLDRQPAADPDLVSRLENLERNSSSPPTAAIAALDKRVATLEGALGGAPDKASAAAYGQRIAALESAALSAKATADANKDALSTAQAARDDAAKAFALATTVAQKADAAMGASAPANQAGADVGALEGRVAKLEDGLAALDRSPVDLGPINQRLDKLESALATPKSENRVAAEAAAPSRDGAGMAVVAQALRDRLRAGGPFQPEQSALEHLGADPTKLAILKGLAEKGAPTAGALAADFARISPAILAAAAPQGSGGVVDRLMTNMSKVVRVTPIGEVSGDDPAALVSQIGAALARGQIGPAVATWRRLSEPARQASQEWASEAQSRLAADEAVQGVLDDAMARLSAASN